MKVNILYFAQVAEKLGHSKEVLEVSEDMGSDSLLELLKSRHPELEKLKYVISVNQVLVKTDTALNEGAEVALLPPFAGG